MEWYAEQLGYGGRKKHSGGMAGLLHDIDFELYPEEHCERARSFCATEAQRKI